MTTDQRNQALVEQRERIKQRSRKQIITHESVNNRFIVTLNIEDAPDTYVDEVVAYFRNSLVSVVNSDHLYTEIPDLVYDVIAAEFPDRHIEITVNDIANNVGYLVVYNLNLPFQSIKI